MDQFGKIEELIKKNVVELDEADKKDSGEPETEVTEPRDVPNAFVVEVQSDDGVVLSSTQAYTASQVKK